MIIYQVNYDLSSWRKGKYNIKLSNVNLKITVINLNFQISYKYTEINNKLQIIL